MDALAITFSSITLLAISTNAVPPSFCSANFRWEDCGREPEPKMYYYKPGSRCEVGIWRGCLPSLNMFKDEFECVSTCIFSVRAQPIDFHQKMVQSGEQEVIFDSENEMTTEGDMEGTTLIEDQQGSSTLDSESNTTVGGATTLSGGTDADNGIPSVSNTVSTTPVTTVGIE